MEICPGISVRIPLRFCQIPRKISQFSFCPHVVASTNLSFDPETLRSESQKRMFILGMGYVGQFFANQLKKQGWFVSGTCTSIVKKEKLDQMGFDAFVFDATNEPLPEVLDVLNYHTHLLVSIPPVLGIGDPMLQYGELLKSRLKDGNLQWLCYLSSTSVYGDCGGAWVDENYPITAETELAKARLAAEEGWLNLGSNLRLTAQVFRLGGIYGPGRSAIDTILKQQPLSDVQIMRSSKSYTSRVHVADICQALNASVQNPSMGKIYNIVDDDPAPRTEVFMFACNLVEKKWPNQVKEARYSDRAKSIILKGSSRGEKRVSNACMKNELGVRLLHPNYQSGLQSIVEHIDDTYLYNPSN